MKKFKMMTAPKPPTRAIIDRRIDALLPVDGFDPPIPIKELYEKYPDGYLIMGDSDPGFMAYVIVKEEESDESFFKRQELYLEKLEIYNTWHKTYAKEILEHKEKTKNNRIFALTKEIHDLEERQKLNSKLAFDLIFKKKKDIEKLKTVR